MCSLSRAVSGFDSIAGRLFSGRRYVFGCTYGDSWPAWLRVGVVVGDVWLPSLSLAGAGGRVTGVSDMAERSRCDSWHVIVAPVHRCRFVTSTSRLPFLFRPLSFVMPPTLIFLPARANR